jgi:hypothetical protein
MTVLAGQVEQEVVTQAGPRLPMILVISEEAAGFLSEDSAEGKHARSMVAEVVKYGRRGGIGYSISGEMLGRLPSDLRRLMLASSEVPDIPGARTAH